MDLIKEKKFSAGLSITSNTIIIILKFIVGIITGSISIISEAIHSLSDVLASILTFFAVMRSSEPADAGHQFGHGKYEDMSGFIEGGLIIFAAIFIIFEACKKLFAGDIEDINSTPGILVMLFSVVANYLVSTYLFYVAKKSNSVSLYADAQHLRTDIYSSFGVMAGLVLIKLTGYAIFDPLIAMLVAFFILKTGYSISRETLNNLLDGALPKEDLEKIDGILKEFTKRGVLECKNLKSRRVGAEKDLEITLIFPETMTLLECHKICDEIEDMIEDQLGKTDILIHPEPYCSHNRCRK